MRVVVDDVERLLGRLERGRLGQLDLEQLSSLEPMALRTTLAVQDHGAVANEPFGQRSGTDRRERGDDGVEPSARVPLRNARAVRFQPTRSCDPPPRTRETAARRR